MGRYTRASSPRSWRSITCRSSTTRSPKGGHAEGADQKQEARTQAVKYTYFMMKLM